MPANPLCQLKPSGNVEQCKATLAPLTFRSARRLGPSAIGALLPLLLFGGKFPVKLDYRKNSNEKIGFPYSKLSTKTPSRRRLRGQQTQAEPKPHPGHPEAELPRSLGMCRNRDVFSACQDYFPLLAFKGINHYWTYFFQGS